MPAEGIFRKDFVADGLGAGWATKFSVLNSFPGASPRTRSLPKTWQCDEPSARRSMNFLADGPASCSVARSHHVYRGSLP